MNTDRLPILRWLAIKGLGLKKRNTRVIEAENRPAVTIFNFVMESTQKQITGQLKLGTQGNKSFSIFNFVMESIRTAIEQNNEMRKKVTKPWSFCSPRPLVYP